MEKTFYRGSIAQDGEDYVSLVGLVGVRDIDVDDFIEIELENIDDNEFSKLLAGNKKVEILSEKKETDIKLYGEIMGGSDPTRPVRAMGEKIEPKQKLTILLEKALEKEQKKAVIGELVKLIIHA